jgi:hypothetical protein
MLSENGETGHSCLVPHLREKVFSSAEDLLSSDLGLEDFGNRIWFSFTLIMAHQKVHLRI